MKGKKYGFTALILAADEGNAKVLRVLIAAGADVNAKTNDGLTALAGVSQFYWLSLILLSHIKHNLGTRGSGVCSGGRREPIPGGLTAASLLPTPPDRTPELLLCIV